MRLVAPTLSRSCLVVLLVAGQGGVRLVAGLKGSVQVVSCEGDPLTFSR